MALNLKTKGLIRRKTGRAKLNNFTAPFGAVFLYPKTERKNYNGT